MPLARVLSGSTDFASAARGAQVVLLTSDFLDATERATLDEIDACRCMSIAFVTHSLSGFASAAALACDWLAISEEGALRVEWRDGWGDAAAGMLRRIGRKGVRLLLEDSEIGAAEALRLGLADGLVPSGTDPVKWLRSWLGTRSAVALGSAASLLRTGGGDALERAEFARLFAIGEPQRGLTAFLERTPPGFDQDLTVETI